MGHHHALAALLEVSGEQVDPPVPELLDLVHVPAVRSLDHRIHRGAVCVVAQLVQLAVDGDVDGGDDLLDPGIAVDPMGAHVLRHVVELAGHEVGDDDALEHLLVHRAFGRAPAVQGHHRLDGRAVDQVEAVEGAALGLPGPDGPSVGHQQVLAARPEPLLPGVLPVGEAQKILDLLAAVVRLLVLVDRPHVPFGLDQHVLLGLDDQAHQVVAIGHVPQGLEADRIPLAGLEPRVDVGVVVELAAFGAGIRHRDGRRAGPEPTVVEA